MARTPPGQSPGEIDLTDMADPMVPMGANPDDVILRRIVESAAYEPTSRRYRPTSSSSG
jgi:hypothetical protein